MNDSLKIKELAKVCGFDACGITSAECLPKDSHYLQQWLNNRFNGDMAYMENHKEKRSNPKLLIPEAKSIVVVLLNYYSKLQQQPDVPQISKYAWGKDYHFIIKKKLKELLSLIQSEVKPCNGTAFCDSAPLFERRLAERAVLGWIGKSTMLINPNLGSYCFIGELLLDIELEYDQPIESKCNNCEACLNACPTKALLKPFSLNASKCLSYQTIELKSDIEKDILPYSGLKLFGCDNCIEVCPWNKKAIQNNTTQLQPTIDFLSMTKKDWENFSRSDFKRLFKNSPLQRAGYKKLRNRLNQMGFISNR